MPHPHVRLPFPTGCNGAVLPILPLNAQPPPANCFNTTHSGSCVLTCNQGFRGGPSNLCRDGSWARTWSGRCTRITG